MSSTTPRLGLKTWDQSDPFLRQDFNDNNGRLDAYPGDYICTSGSRPTWGAAQANMRIYETDTRREMVWTGTAWREILPAGPVFPGSVRPSAVMALDTHVYYRLATFTLTRPGTLLVDLVAEISVQSTYTANVACRAQIDGSDALVGDDGSILRAEQVHTSGAGWERTYMVPVKGMRVVGVGSHNFGIHVHNRPGATTKTVSVTLKSSRGWAQLANSTDT
jgi:hypothetical protein